MSRHIQGDANADHDYNRNSGDGSDCELIVGGLLQIQRPHNRPDHSHQDQDQCEEGYLKIRVTVRLHLQVYRRTEGQESSE